MRTPLALTAVALLTTALVGCGGPGAASGPASASPSATPSGGASSPEAAAETLLRGIGAKDPKAICAVAAIQGKPVGSSGLTDQCIGSWRTTLDGLGGSTEPFLHAQVDNVPVEGDRADLSRGTVSPEQARSYLIANRQAQLIGGRWFVLLGG